MGWPRKIPLKCGVAGCDKKHKAHGLCRLHWERNMRTGSTDGPIAKNCIVDGCVGKHYGVGFCRTHWKRKYRTGDTGDVQPRICAACHKEFTPHQKQPHALACSRHCANAVHYAKRKAAEPNVACETCGKLFAPLKPDTKRCSHKCAAPFVIAARTRDKICADCGDRYKSKVVSNAHETCPNCSRERMRRRHVTRRSVLNGSKGPSHTLKDWIALLARYRGMCAYCGIRKAEHRDHVFPIARGGIDSIGNILPACPSCNCSKGSKLLYEWKLGRKCADENQKPRFYT